MKRSKSRSKVTGDHQRSKSKGGKKKSNGDLQGSGSVGNFSQRSKEQGGSTESLNLKWGKGKRRNSGHAINNEDGIKGEGEIPEQSKNLLFDACKAGKVRMVEKLICRFHYASELRDSHLRTPLLVAAQHNREDVVRFLLEEGHANVDACDMDHWTCLTWMVVHDNIRMAKYLVEHGKATVSVCDKLGRNLLHYASVSIGLYLYATNHTRFSSVACLAFLKHGLTHSRSSPEALFDIAKDGVQVNDSPLSVCLTLSWLFRQLSEYDLGKQERYNRIINYFDTTSQWLFQCVESDGMAAFLLEHGEGTTVPPVETALSTENIAFLTNERVKSIVNAWYRGKVPVSFDKQGIMDCEGAKDWVRREKSRVKIVQSDSGLQPHARDTSASSLYTSDNPKGGKHSHSFLWNVFHPMKLFRTPIFQTWLRYIGFLLFCVCFFVFLSDSVHISDDISLIEWGLYLLAFGWMLEEAIDAVVLGILPYWSFPHHRWSFLSLVLVLGTAIVRLSGDESAITEGFYTFFVLGAVVSVCTRVLYMIGDLYTPLATVLATLPSLMNDIVTALFLSSALLFMTGFMLWFLFEHVSPRILGIQSYSGMFQMLFEHAISGNMDLDVYEDASPVYKQHLGKAIICIFMLIVCLFLLNIIISMFVSTFLSQKKYIQSYVSYMRTRSEWYQGLNVATLPTPLNLVALVIFSIVFPFFFCVRYCQNWLCPTDEPVFFSEEICTIASSNNNPPTSDVQRQSNQGSISTGGAFGSELEVHNTNDEDIEANDGSMLPTDQYCVYCLQHEKAVEIRQRRALLVGRSQQELRASPSLRSPYTKQAATGTGHAPPAGLHRDDSIEMMDAKQQRSHDSSKSSEKGKGKGKGKGKQVNGGDEEEEKVREAQRMDQHDLDESGMLERHGYLFNSLAEVKTAAKNTHGIHTLVSKREEAVVLEHLYTYGSICECGRTKRFGIVDRFLYQWISSILFCLLLWPIVIVLCLPAWMLWYLIRHSRSAVRSPTFDYDDVSLRRRKRMGKLGALLNVRVPDACLPDGSPALQDLYAVCNRGFSDLRKVHHIKEPRNTSILSEYYAGLPKRSQHKHKHSSH